MLRSAPLRGVLYALLTLIVIGPTSRAQEDLPQGPVSPTVAPASDEGVKAIARFKVPPGLRVELFAAEPMLANPVAFAIDEKNRFYVAETFRLHAGVTDTRGHMNWLDDDLACRTVADRVAMYKKFFSPQEFASYSANADRIRLIVDRDGDGKADTATVFADGFHDAAVGLGAGLLARRGDVYYTNIPDLWLMRDRNGDGKADERTSLHNGYGVHVAFLGHDLHGLKLGPDGRLYFTIGDRGFNVRTNDGKSLAVINEGTVLRCEPDGSNLEVFAHGLRNPQEIAFNEFGDLFTVDNNSDGGDRARLVHIVKGGDSGWRIGYQFIEEPNSRGPWNAEKLWQPRPENTAAYLLPPLANMSDGPSGLVYDPGTGLNPAARGRFFLADFRGSAGTSGVRSFALRQEGPSYALADQQQYLWGLEATDVDFGTDGALYVSDWVEGWNMTGKGRIYRLVDPASGSDPLVAEVRTLLAEGFTRLTVPRLRELLSHPDMRVRQEAQFELVARTKNPVAGPGPELKLTPDHEAAIRALAESARSARDRLGRIHGLWGLGQVLRKSHDTERLAILEPLYPLLADRDPEIRGQAAKALAESVIMPVERVLPLLDDPEPRVRFQAMEALAGLKSSDGALAKILDRLRSDDGKHPYFRHAAVEVLAFIAGTRGRDEIMKHADDASPNVRLALVLMLRRRMDPEVARFLSDPDQTIVLEAAGAVSESEDMAEAVPKLAALSGRQGLSEALMRRVLWANAELGNETGARALVELATRRDVPESARREALRLLAAWAKPSPRHPITGVWRYASERPAAPAAEALARKVDELLGRGPEAVRRESARAVAALGVRTASPALARLVESNEVFASTRVEALKALGSLGTPELSTVLPNALKGSNGELRMEALRLLSRLRPTDAIEPLKDILARGAIRERQAALGILGDMKDPAADRLLGEQVERLTRGETPAEARLDVLEAASKRVDESVKAKLAAYESTRSKSDPLAAYREALVGGDAARGRKIFREKQEVQCLRCHKVEGNGGEVGPDLAGIAKKQPREYLLESIVTPNAKIAEGFESVVLGLSEGQVVAGVLRSEDANSIRIITAEGKPLTIAKSEVEERKRGASAMPEDLTKSLSRFEIRDLIEFLASQK